MEGTTADQGVIVADGIFSGFSQPRKNLYNSKSLSSRLLLIVYVQEDSIDYRID